MLRYPPEPTSYLSQTLKFMGAVFESPYGFGLLGQPKLYSDTTSLSS